MKDGESDDFYDKYVQAKRASRILAAVLVVVAGLFVYGTVTFFTCDELKEQHCWLNLRQQHSLEQEKLSHHGGVVENQHNAVGKLDLVSAYGDNQPYHPKVLNFAEAWHGYKYWMTYSPFPNGDEKYENPHIRASNDLMNWEIPEGLTNPIEDTPENYEKSKVYNSDPHIVYNNDTDTMELFWRYVDDVEDVVIIYRKTSKDGVKWSDKDEILRATRSKKDYISPAIIYENGTYKWWFVDRDRSLKYMESKDNSEFLKEKSIKLEYAVVPITNWHIDVIKTDDQYEMLMVGYYKWEDRNSMNLYYFNSRDGVEWHDGSVILRPSISSWDNRGIYRSSFIKENGVYYVFYSGVSTNMERGIGMSYGENIHDLIGSNPDEAPTESESEE